jgi:hypothetical protein
MNINDNQLVPFYDTSNSSNSLVPHSENDGTDYSSTNFAADLTNDQKTLRNFTVGFYDINKIKTNPNLHAEDLKHDVPNGYYDIKLFQAYNLSDETLAQREAFFLPLTEEGVASTMFPAYLKGCNKLMDGIIATIPMEDVSVIRPVLLTIAKAGSQTACYQLINLMIYGAPIVNFVSFQSVASILLTRLPTSVPEIIVPFIIKDIDSLSWMRTFLPSSITDAIQNSIILTIQNNPGTTTAVCFALASGSALVLGAHPITLVAKGSKLILTTLTETVATTPEPGERTKFSIAWHLEGIVTVIRSMVFGN